MLRQEIVVCQKCGSLKELGDDCECSNGEDKSLETKDRNMDQR